MATSAAQQHIEAILTPALAAGGYELVQLAYADAGHTLRLTIDHLVPKAEPQPGVSLEDCARASKVANAALEAAGTPDAAGHDSLEVSSPGIERPLVKPAHFRRFVGQPVRLQLKAGAVEGKVRRLFAKLVAANDAGIELGFDAPHYAEQPHRPAQLAYTQIDRANLVYEVASPITDQQNRGPQARARAKE